MNTAPTTDPTERILELEEMNRALADASASVQQEVEALRETKRQLEAQANALAAECAELTSRVETLRTLKEHMADIVQRSNADWSALRDHIRAQSPAEMIRLEKAWGDGPVGVGGFTRYLSSLWADLDLAQHTGLELAVSKLSVRPGDVVVAQISEKDPASRMKLLEMAHEAYKTLRALLPGIPGLVLLGDTVQLSVSTLAELEKRVVDHPGVWSSVKRMRVVQLIATRLNTVNDTSAGSMDAAFLALTEGARLLVQVSYDTDAALQQTIPRLRAFIPEFDTIFPNETPTHETV